MPQPWEQQPGESSARYAKFVYYRNMGPGRSLDEAYRIFWREHYPTRGEPPKLAAGGWRLYSRTHSWVSRAREYDIHVGTMADEARHASIKDAAKVAGATIGANSVDWDARRQSIREREWTLAEELEKKMRQMLAMPLVKQTVRTGLSGEQITTIEPVRWTMDTIAKMGNLLVSVRRMAADLPPTLAAMDGKTAAHNEPMFESDGEVAAAVGPGRVPEMPERVAVKPKLDIVREAEAAGLVQPAFLPRPQPR